ncbi:MAG: SAM-dependent DNA methyltransferase, partial [Gemmatimonadaceae bacterium]
EEGIPDEAYAALTGDDKAVVKELKKQNAAARTQLERERKSGQITFLFATDEWAQALAAVDAMPDGSLAEVAEKETALRRVMESDANRSRFAQDVYVSAFLLPKTTATKGSVPTTATLRDVAAGVRAPRVKLESVTKMARVTPFLHWSVTFAPVMARGGFDCVLGNPPWEKVTLNDREFFASRAPDIANAPNGAARLAMIKALAEQPQESPPRRLYDAYVAASRESDGFSLFAHNGGRCPLTGSGIVNLYALFAETALRAIRRDGRAGLVLPSGIATDDGTAGFFREISAGRLVSLIDFENREALFQAVHRSYKFCLLTIGQSERPTFAFFLTQPEQRFDERRRFTLTRDDLARLNPNTRTAPIFRSQADAELTAKIYRNVPVLWDETREDGNPWGLSFRQGLFNMTSDSHLFRTAPGPGLVALYEAKMIHQFAYRFATYIGGNEDLTREVTEDEKRDPDFRVRPRYWVPEEEVEARLRARGWDHPWLLGWRDITNATNERTVIASVIPRVGVGHTTSLFFVDRDLTPVTVACFLATFNSLVFDYVARQKIGGTHLSYFLVKQLPTPAPDQFDEVFADDIATRVAALSLGTDISDFRDALCRAPIRRPLTADTAPVVRAELDALLAHRFGLDRDDLRFVLDPSERFGDSDYPTETFRVLKENDIRRYGEYRTRRVVLEAWDRFAADRIQPEAVPASPPPVSPDEDLAFVIVAVVRANGGSIERVALARAVSLLRKSAYLVAHASAPRRAEATKLAKGRAERSTEASSLMVMVDQLVSRSALGYDVSSARPRVFLTTTSHTPVESALDPWYTAEARLVLDVLNTLPAIEVAKVDSALAQDEVTLVHAQVA